MALPLAPGKCGLAWAIMVALPPLPPLASDWFRNGHMTHFLPREGNLLVGFEEGFSVFSWMPLLYVIGMQILEPFQPCGHEALLYEHS